jgi:hypothetical protein
VTAGFAKAVNGFELGRPVEQGQAPPLVTGLPLELKPTLELRRTRKPKPVEQHTFVQLGSRGQPLLGEGLLERVNVGVDRPPEATGVGIERIRVRKRSEQLLDRAALRWSPQRTVRSWHHTRGARRDVTDPPEAHERRPVLPWLVSGRPIIGLGRSPGKKESRYRRHPRRTRPSSTRRLSGLRSREAGAPRKSRLTSRSVTKRSGHGSSRGTHLTHTLGRGV